jgi:GT2 family glycosyltransferase
VTESFLRTACVIVTYNRLSMLKEAVAAVQAQTRPPDRIIVVDNRSADGTSDWLRNLDGVDALFLTENLGGAGGFHFGIKRAVECGADWIWTMDDDCLPRPDALEKLLNSGILVGEPADDQIGFLASRVEWTDGRPHRMNVPGPSREWTDGHPNDPSSLKIRYASFVSILINARAVYRVGLPIPEFFIYCDDVEFTRRITRAGFSAYYLPESRATHRTTANRGVTLQSLTAYPEQHGNRPLIVRNLLAVNRDEPFGHFKESARLLYILGKGFLARNPLPVLGRFLTAGIQGLFWRYRRYVVFPGRPGRDS